MPHAIWILHRAKTTGTREQVLLKGIRLFPLSSVTNVTVLGLSPDVDQESEHHHFLFQSLGGPGIAPERQVGGQESRFMDFVTLVTRYTYIWWGHPRGPQGLTDEGA